MNNSEGNVLNTCRSTVYRLFRQSSCFLDSSLNADVVKNLTPRFVQRESALYWTGNRQGLDAVFIYFAVMNLFTVKPQFLRVSAGLFTYRTPEYLL